MRAFRVGALLACLLAARGAAALTVAVHDAAGPAADVVVALEPLDAPVAPASASASIDQADKQFAPRISVVRTGTLITFPNSDRIRHEVYSFSPAKTFTLKLYAGKSAPPVLFDHAGLVVLGCNIHDRMVAFVAVVDSPYFGRTDAQGHVAIAVPPGHYRLRIWHPDLTRPIPAETLTLGAEPRTVSVEIGRADTGSVAPLSE
jgi:plastocyanin